MLTSGRSYTFVAFRYDLPRLLPLLIVVLILTKGLKSEEEEVFL